MRFATLFFAASIMLALISGCGHKKLVVKNCERAGNAELWVCDPL